MIFVVFVKGVDVVYGIVKVLYDVSFDIYEVCIVVVVGELGFGKLIMVCCIIGFLLLIKGYIEFDGQVLLLDYCKCDCGQLWQVQMIYQMVDMVLNLCKIIGEFIGCLV